MEPGTQCVLMAGTPLEKKLELYAVLLATAAGILVRNYLVYSIITTISHDFLLLTNSAIVDYGRGTSPVLKLNNDCDISSGTLMSNCSKREVNIEQCMTVMGIDCRGIECGFSKYVF